MKSSGCNADNQGRQEEYEKNFRYRVRRSGGENPCRGIRQSKHRVQNPGRPVHWSPKRILPLERWFHGLKRWIHWKKVDLFTKKVDSSGKKSDSFTWGRIHWKKAKFICSKSGFIYQEHRNMVRHADFIIREMRILAGIMRQNNH